MTDNISQLNGPFRLLPPELSARIFKHAIRVDVHTINHYRRVPHLTTPLTLGAVCSSWRSFVWNTPTLWRIIVLLLSQSRYQSQLNILKLWLNNSRSCQLDIWFNNNWPYKDDSLVVIPLQLSTAESLRWRKLNTVVAFTTFADVLVQVYGKIPRLQSCYLQWVYNDTGPGNARNTIARMNMFEDAPLLKSFTFSGDAAHNIGAVKVPWSQLTSFHAISIDEKDWLTTLPQCTSLIECTITSELCNTGVPCPDVDIPLPELCSLSVSEGWCMQGKTWRKIHSPKLTRLHLSDCDGAPWRITVQHFKEFITRSQCSLRHLQLVNLNNILDILPLLDRIPSLESLTLQGQYDNCESFHIIEIMRSFLAPFLTKLDLSTNPSTIVLPKLQKFQLELNNRNTTWDFRPYIPTIPQYLPVHLRNLPPPPPPAHGTCTDLLKVLRSRFNPPEGVSKLYTVVLVGILTLDESRDGGAIAELEALKREGLNIMITDGNSTVRV